ncbi:immunoglobulin-like domain-containing protein [Ideonella sp. BN130291]|uniref:immunoglobulin-like domain-containing protein n=1 Tax=Ideonella sp. BN130291 TaxID=3112940 RepID=UPI002E271169|nr:immunoglobulin-like domain-containing protein [Ideonella sp. BN130291]
MPILLQTIKGTVTGLWGVAQVKGADGVVRMLKLGDVVHKGEAILTSQDGIVQLTPEDEGTAVAVAAKPAVPGTDLDETIAQIERGDQQAVPAAGLAADGGGGLTPGLRVDRITESVSGGGGPAPAADVNTPAVTFAGGNPAARPADTATPDAAPAPTVGLSASAATAAEGGAVVYTATVSTPVTGSPLVLTLSNGQTITIPVGQNTGTSAPFVLRNDDAYAQGDQTVSVDIVSATGGGFPTLTASSTAATTVTDDLDATTVTLSASAGTVTEGGAIVYTATVNNPVTGAPLVITLSNGQTIAIPVGQSSANSAPFAVRADDAYGEGNQTVTTGIASTSGGNYEALTTASTASTVVTDDADVTTVSLSATPSVAEGGTITYTATLSQAALTPVTVTLSNGATIAIAAGQASGSTSVAAPSDDVYVDAGTVSATISSATGGGFETLTANPAAASTSVTDTVDNTTVSLSGSGSVAEGASGSYTVSLNAPAQTAVTVNLAYSGTAADGSDFTGVASVTIAAGASSANFSIATVDDAAAEGSESFTVSLVSASGGNFEALALNGTASSVTTTVVDNDVSVLSLAATPSITEAGGTIVYTASLTQAPVSDLTVTLSNGQTITVLAGQTSGSVSVPFAPADDVYVDASTVSASITGTSGGGILLSVDPTPATTSITDTIDATTVTLTASANTVAEGGTIIYTASVNNPVTGSPLVVTLSNGQTITIPVGQSSANSAAFAVRADDAYAQGDQTVTASITSTSGGNYEALTTTSTASTVVTDDGDATVVTLSASTNTVAEGGSIVYTVAVNNPVAGAPLVVTLSNGQTITIPVGQSSANSAAFAVRADDAYAQGNQTVTTSITSTSGGNYEALTTTSTASTVVTDDGDATVVTLTASTNSVVEGGSITYSAAVNNPVAGTPLVITLSNGQTITIPVGQSSASSAAFPVRADDAYAQGNQTVTTGIASTSGGNYEALTTTSTASTVVTDDADATTVSLSATPSVAEGGTITYTATLSQAALTPVNVTLSNGATIAIAAGQTSGSTSVAAPSDDVYVDGGTVTATITAATGGGFESLTANPAAASTSVTDTVDTTTVSLSGSGSVAEGVAGSYTVSLNAPAQTAVTVTLAYTGTAADGSDFTGVASVTIAAGASSANFSVATLDDALAEGSESFTVSLVSASGGNFEALALNGTASSVTTTVVDNDVSVLSLTATPSITEAGGTIVYTASLTQAPVSDLTVTLSNGQTITVLAGQTSGSVSVPFAPADDVYVDASTVSASITGTSGGGILLSVDPTPATTAITDTIDATTVTLTASANTVAEGGSIIYTASVNNPVTGSPLVVTLTNGQTITIPVGQSAGDSTPFAVRADDAYAQGNQTITAGIASTSGGNYEALTTTSTASTTVTDDGDVTTVTLAATASVAEGGVIAYTATLSQAALTPVSVTLSNGATISIAAGQTSGTTTVAAPTDDVYLDAGSVSATITAATGGGFESLVADPGAAVTTVTDTPDATTVTLTASANTVAEGGAIVYTATVNNPVTGSPLVVTLTNGQTITIPVGQAMGNSAPFAVRPDDADTQGNQTLTTGIASTAGGNYEALVATSTASTTVTDDGDITTVTLTASANTASEGGSIVYTAAVNNPVAGSPLVITLSNGQTITIPVGQSSASSAAFAVRADDAYAQGNQTVTASISSASGGNYEALTTASTASTVVTDDGDTTVVTLTASTNTVAEGGSIVYTVAVNNPVTGTPLVVTLSNGQTITIPVGQSSANGAAFAVRGDDAYAQGNQTVTTSIASTSGGNYEALTTTSTASTVVTDDGDATVVTLTASANTLAEGGSIVYTAAVNNPVTGTPLVITLSNGQTITIPVGQSSANSAAFAVRADDAYAQGNQTVTTSIASTSGGTYEALTTTSTASTVVTDDGDATVVTLTASTNTVAEGGSIVYTAAVNNPVTGTPLVITLSNGQTITIPVGQSAADSTPFAVRADDAYAQGNQTVTTSIASTSGGNYEALTTTSTASTVVTDDSDATTVTLSATPTVAEGGSIVYTATLDQAALTPVSVTLSNGATITIAAGQTSGTTTVAAPTDDVYVDAGTVTATITAATGGGFENLVVNPAAASTSVTDTVDTTTVSLSGSGSVAEGASGSYTVSLNAPAQTAVTVNLAYTGTAADGSDFTGVASVTIAAGASSANFSIATLDDALAEGSESFTVSLVSASGGNFEALALNGAASSVTTTVVDNDVSVLSLAATPSITEAGGTIVYTASLTQAPVSDLTVTLSNGQTITVLAGQTTGSVSVPFAPADDVYVDATTVSATVTSTSGGGILLSVDPTPATTAITDTIDATTVTLTASTNTVAEGGSIVYTAAVNSPVTGTPLVVTLSNGQTITIPVGQSAADSTPFAVRADDAYAQGNQTVTTSIASTSGGNYEALTTTSTASTVVTDDSDATTVTLSATPTVAEGGSIVYTATLDQAALSPVSVTLSNGATITIAAGQTSGTTTVAAPTDDVYVDAGTVTATITAATGGGFENLVVNPAAASTSVTDTVDTTTVSLSGSGSVAEGVAGSYTVSLNAPAQTAVTVTLAYTGTAADGSDFTGVASVTIAAGSSSADFSIATLDDAAAEGSESFTVSLVSASGGNFEALALNGAASSVTTTVVDNDVSVLSLAATPSITEAGGAIVYTASLTQAPVSDLAVTLSNGATITVLAGQTSGSVSVPFAPADDVYLDASTVSASISGTSGGGILLSVDPTPATTAITDTINATTVTLTASANTVAEGGSIVYTAAVNSPVTGSPLVITLSNGQTITIPVGQSAADSTPFAVRADDAYAQGNQTVTTSIASTSGGNYEALTTTSTASTEVTDDGDATVVTLTASANTVAEGGSIVYTAAVNNPVAGSPLVLTLSNGQTITIPVGQSSASSAAFAVRADDAYAQGNQTVTTSITAASGGSYEALTTTSTASTVVTDDSDATVVTLTASAGTVVEGGSIVYTATVNNVVTGAPLVVTLTNGQSITIPVGQSSADSTPFAVRADDAYAQGNQTVTAGIASASGGNYEALATTSTASTIVTDNSDATTVTLSAVSSVVEGGSIVYTASVNNPVTGSPLVVTLTNGQTITIPVGQSSADSAPFAVRADDAYAQGNQTVTTGIASTSGGTYESLVTASSASTVVTDDSDVTTVTLSATPTVAEGGSIVYTATLDQAALTPVSVTLSNGATITIAAGRTSGTVAVAAPGEDVYVDADTVSATITGATGGGFENLAVNPAAASTSVTDTVDTTTVSLSGSGSVAEGASGSYTVSLDAPAQTAVTVNLAYSGTAADGSDFTGVASVTIAAGASSANFSIATLDDAAAEGSESFTVSLVSASGGNFEALALNGAASSVTTTVVDNDVSVLSLAATPSITEAGGAIVYTASLTQAPVTDLTVTLSNGQVITVLAGQTSGSVSVPFAPADDVYVDATTVSATVTGTSGGGILLSVDPTPATTAITDTIDATTVTLTASANTVAEGGSIVYTAAVNSPVTGSPLVVTLSNGQTITIPVGQSFADSTPFAVRADDAYAQGNQTVTTSITSTSGGNYEALTTTSTASTVVTDDGDATVVTLTASTNTVAEGGSIVYTAAVNSPVTGSPLVVTLSNGQTITIPVGQSSANSAAFPIRADDAYTQGSQTVTTSISSTSGGNYEALTTTSTASTTVTDDGDATVVTLTASVNTVAEGGSIFYTAAVNNPVTGSPLVVTLSNGQTITIPVGQSSANSAAFAVRADDAYAQGNQTVTTSIASTSGGNYEALTTTSTASTVVTDDGDATVVTLTASANTVTEGGSIVYTAAVNNPVAGSPLLVTLSNGQTITIPVGQSSANSAAFPVRADDAYAQGNQTVTTGIASTSGGNYEALTTTSTASTVVTDDADATTVSLSATPSVAEGGTITYTATLSQAALTPVSVTLSNGATIAIAAGQTSGSTSVAAPSDDVYVDAGTVTATITAATGGGFESLAVNPAAASTSVTDTVDTTTVSLSGSSSVAEGASGTYTVSLNAPGQTAVTVNLAYSGTAADGSDFTGVASVTIAAGASSANFSIATLDDALAEGSESFTVSLVSASGGNFEALALNGTASSVTTAVVDNDVSVLSLAATPSITEAGGTIVYTASLTQAPVSDLTVTLSNGQTITVLAGQTSGSVSVPFAPADDVYVDASTVSATVKGTSGGGILLSVDPTAATTAIADTIDATTLTLTASANTVAEGGSIVYTATVNNPVTGSPLVITLTNGQSITIPVGQSSANSAAFAVRADDAYAQGNQTLTTGIASTSGGNYEALTTSSTASTTVTDDGDASVVTLTASANTVAEGGSIVYTAAVNNPVTGSPLVITLSNGQTITIPVGQSSANSTAFAVRADDAYAQGNQTVTTSISSTTGGNYETLTTTSTAATVVTDDADATVVTLTASTNTVAEGGSIVYTAAVNNPVTGTPLVITLNNGQTITIPVGQSSANSTAFPVRADDAYAQGNQTITTSISSTSGGNYEALTTTSTASTTVTDDGDATTVTLTASANTVAEGGSIVYTATVNNPVTNSPLVITLSNGQTITIPVGQSSANSAAFLVRADDAYAQGNQTVTTSISSTAGGNYEALTTTSTASTVVTDDGDATVVTLTASANTVAEGGSIVYTAAVNNPVTGSPLVITLSNGQTITIPVGQSSANSAAFAVRADDVYAQGNQTVTASIASTSGGNYEALTTTSTASTVVTDDGDATVVTLTVSANTVAEGGSIVYTAAVNNPVTGSPLVITLSNGQTITIPVGQSSANSAAFAVRADDAYAQGNQTVTTSISSTSGGNYEALTTTSTASTVVTDDADATVVTLTASTNSVVEGGSITYTAAVNNAVTGTPLVITLTNGQTITIPVGQSSASSTAFTVRADDAYAQGNQTVTTGIASTSGGTYEALTTTSTASTVVTDDADATTVSLSATPSVAEGGTITYTATLSQAALTPVSVTLSNGATIAIAAGQTSGSTSVAAPSDDVYVDAGTVSATISSATGGGFEVLTTNPAAATTSVTDTINPTTVNLSGAVNIVEGNSGSYTVTLSSPAQGAAVTVNLAYSGTAANGTDYTGVATVTIPAGASSASFNLATIDDALAETGEQFTVTVTSASGGSFESLVPGSSASVTTSITDEATPDTVLVSLSGPATVTEGSTTTAYTVSLTQPAATAVTVNLTYSGTAGNGTDYTQVVSVTIPAGASSATFTLPTTGDTLDEPNETIVLSLGSVSGGGFEAIAVNGAASSVTTTIVDDDPTPSLAINDVSVNEAAGTATFTVTLSAVSGQTVTVGFNTSNGTATAGSDYTAATGTLTFAPGVTSQTITVPVLNDAVFEGAETFNVNLTGPTNATIADNLGVGTIRDDGTGTGGTDNDTPALSVSSPTVVESGGFAQFTVALSNASASATTVSLGTTAGTATSGADYSTALEVSTDGGANWTAASSATIAAGATSVLVRVPITSDALDEANETFTLTATRTAGTTSNGSATGTATITDDDPLPALAINDVSINEAAGTATFTVTLNAASGQTVTVGYNTSNGTATAGSDYTAASGTLTFGPGVVSQTITVPITNDTATEASETFNVNLASPTNATIADNLGVGTIVDNDAPPAIDLDGNNSTATGTAFVTSYTENGSGVSIADADLSITDVDSSTLTGATVTLTNRQAGDLLNLGANVGGVTAAITTSTASTVTITLSGSGTLAEYTQRLQNITFSSTSDTPSTTPRTINISVTDGQSSSNTATTTVNVIAVNDLPTGRDVTLTATEDTARVFTTADFLMNDAEDGTNVAPTSVRIDTLPDNGSIYLNGVLVTAGQVVTAAQITAGQLTYEPGFNANGSAYASFSFSVRDSGGGFDTVPNTATINVTAVNDGAPVASADAFTTTLGTPVIISQAQLLANDVLPDHATLTAVSAGTGGTLVNNGNGTYTFTPSAIGNGSFTYTLTDEDGQTSTGTVTVNTVAAVDDLATVHESALSAGTGGGTTTASGNVLTNDGGGTQVNSVSFNGTTITDGSASDTDSRAGFIGVTTSVGKMVMQTTGTGAGSYTYTLNKAADNSASANDLSTTEVFNYTSNATTAALRVKVVDDEPLAYDRQIAVSQVPLPSYNLVLVLDVSGSMTGGSSGGEVRQVNADGSTTITTRLAMAKQAMVQLVTEYFNQAQSVSVKLVTFSDSATILNGNNAYTDKATLISAINAITGSGGTNYESALSALQTAFGTVDQSKNNASYFLSDGEPSSGNTATGLANYQAFTTTNNISSYAVGVGTGISNTSALDGIHNVDGDGDGVKDSAIIVPDTNQLGSALLSTVPPAFGGNLVTNSAASNVLGADGGYLQTVTIKLDSNSDGVPDQDVTFTYNKATNQISQNSAFLTGFPKTGDLLTLGTGTGFKYGTLTLNFSTGNYTFYTNGTSQQGDAFTVKYVAQDGDGDITPQTTLTFEIDNAKPVARPDTDTVLPGSTHTDGNVITGLDTDGGLSLGSRLASFSSKGSGVDTTVDNAQVSSVAFKGASYNLLANSSGSGTGFSYTIAAGKLTWTGTDGSKLVFTRDGYYDYTPPTASAPQVTYAAAVTTNFNTSGGATANGVALTGFTRTGATTTLSYTDSNNNDRDGVGVTGGSSNNTVDNLERLVISFSQASHAYGVGNVSFVIAPDASDLGASGGVVSALTYTVYDVAGNQIGQFYSSSEGTVTVPSTLTNIGSIEIEANSAASARVTSVSFADVQLNTGAAEVAPVQVGYTLTDDQGDTSSSTLTLNVATNNLFGTSANDTLTGTNANDRVWGGAGNDTIAGGSGHDIVDGGAGNDAITGGDGNDLLRGGAGNDTIDGGNGNDIIVGGGGTDLLIGGAGSDVFRWELADQGTAGTPATDTIQGFDTAAASAGGDVLDLRDLLQGETAAGSATGNLTSFLHFAQVGSDTLIQISSKGGFSGGFNAGAVDQTITLQSVDLTAGGLLHTDQQIIQDLINKSKLLVDGGG